MQNSKKRYAVNLYDGAYYKTYATAKATYLFITRDNRALNGGTVKEINEFGDVTEFTFLQFVIFYLREHVTSAISSGKKSPLW